MFAELRKLQGSGAIRQVLIIIESYKSYKSFKQYNKEEKGDRTMTLGDAKVGTTVVVTKIEGDGAYKRRIMDMGITKGSELYIRKVAPLGDPVEITVRGYELSVRKNDAQCVQVK